MQTGPSRAVCGALAALLVAISGVAATPEAGPIFSLVDPRNDDFGDGTMVYPLRDDLNPGDLDLLSLVARPEKGGYIFEATMARRIRPPARRTIDSIGTSLDTVARFGFYTFNIDIYIDTDRVEGSGSTLTLPGRRAAVHPKDAWEKAICLTPRPFEAREALKGLLEREARAEVRRRQGRVDAAERQSIEAGVARDVAEGVFFPTLIWVAGPKIRFFVPESFLGAELSPRWGYVVAVSGADIGQRFDVGPLLGAGKSAEPRLAIIPLKPGKGRDHFGGGQEDDELQPPLVDIIVPRGFTQEGILKDYELGTLRPVMLRAVVPAEQ